MSRAVAPLRDWHPLSSAVFGGLFFFFSKGGTCCRLLPCTHFFSESSKKQGFAVYCLPGMAKLLVMEVSSGHVGSGRTTGSQGKDGRGWGVFTQVKRQG